MKFLCDRSRLEAALVPILPAIPTKDSPHPALKSLHVRAEEDVLVLQGSNMELSVEIRLDAVKIQRSGSCLVPAKPLYALLHEVPDTTIRVEVDNGALLMPTSTGRFELVTGSADDFPALDFCTEGEPLRIPTELLARQFHCTEFASAREASRYAMNGLLITIGDGKLATVATDGRRLALIHSSIEDRQEPPVTALLPHKSLAAAVKAVEGMSEEHLGVHVGEGAVCFAFAGGRIQVQQISGAFPDYQAVIPRSSSNTVELDRTLFEANLRRTTVMTEEMNPAVKITFEKDQARFESEAAGVGSADTSMNVQLTGKGGHIIFNPHFLVDVLRVVDQDQLRFEFEDANSPGKFVLGEEFVYVVMPITGV